MPKSLVNLALGSAVFLGAATFSCAGTAAEATQPYPTSAGSFLVAPPSALTQPVTADSAYSPPLIVIPPATVMAAEPTSTTIPMDAFSSNTSIITTTLPPFEIPIPLTATPPSLSKSGIDASPLTDIDPDAVGLLTSSTGSLGANIWTDTPRSLVERLLPEVSLPTASASLNSLARRLLLSTTQVPSGKANGTRSLTSLRIEKLVALGDNDEAWDLTRLIKPEKLDDATLRLVAEGQLIKGENKTLCDQVPSLMKDRETTEWQKLLVVCQLRAGDANAAQLSLDLMHDAPAKDEVFLGLISKNIQGNSKQLPRQLLPLKAINLSLLRQTDLPLPPEVFNRAEASMISALLQAKTQDEGAKIAMAEKAASKGLITATALAEAYKSANTTASTTKEMGSHTRAVIFQELLKETEPTKRIEFAEKFLQSLDSAGLNGTTTQALADVLADIAPEASLSRNAVFMTHLMARANKLDQARAWFKLTHNSSSNSDAQAQLQNIWPLLAVSGLLSDTEYSQQLGPWLDAMLKETDKARRQQIGADLLLLSAAGYAIPEETWGRVIDTTTDTKRMVQPSALLLARLHEAGTAARKGETVLLSLLLAGGSLNETPLFVFVDVVRALRLNGFGAEAEELAREMMVALTAPSAS